MNKGIIFDILLLENGFVLTLFRLFQFGMAKDDEGAGPFISLIIGFHKLELTTSLTWRIKEHGKQKSKKKSKSKSKATIASA